MDKNEKKQVFYYSERKNMFVVIQWILTTVSLLMLFIWNYYLTNIRPISLDMKWCLIIDIIIVVLIVSGARKFHYLMWSKKIHGECLQSGKSVFLRFGVNRQEIRLDDIREIGIYDNSKRKQGVIQDLLDGWGLNIAPIWMLDSARGTICLEIITDSNSFRFIDGPMKNKNLESERNGLYETMKMIKNTYDMKQKKDNNGLPILDVYII